MKNLTRTAVLALALVAGCMTVGDSPDTPQVDGDSPWLRPSAVLQTQIDENAERLPWTHGIERLELLRWFVGLGEPGYETLLGLAEDPRPDVAGSALAALGSTRDQRLVPYIHTLDWPPGASQELELERARTLFMLGDWSQVSVLIDGLESDDIGTRALSGHALFRVTGDSMGFDPQGEPEERAVAVERWREWWQTRTDEGILVSSR